MYALLISTLALLSGANAQYGHGYYGALRCPRPPLVAPAAVDPNDLLLNNRGLVRHSQTHAQVAHQRMRMLDGAIAQERLQLQQILGAPATLAIEEHRRFGRGPGAYAAGCPVPPRVAGPAVPSAGIVLPPTPPVFCVNNGGRVENLWVNGFAGPGGLVNDSICNLGPGFRGPVPPVRAQLCRRHLHGYYQRLAEKAALEQELAAWSDNVRAWEFEQAELINAQTQARRCVGCENGVLGASPNPLLGGDLAPIAQVLQAVLGGGRGLSRGFAGGGFGGGFGPYPGSPYVARLRGYYGARGGQWGAVGGGLGQGAFDECGGLGAVGLGAQFAPPVQPALAQRGVNPLDPRYANALLDPSLDSDLFNPGFGPGFGPTRGNGLDIPPRILPAVPAPIAPRPLAFAQTQPLVPVTQLGFGNLGAQLGPGGLVGTTAVRTAFPVPPPAVMPAVQTAQFVNPAFAVGQPVPPAVTYGVLGTQVNRVQYGLGLMQGQPIALPLAAPIANPVVRPPAPAVLPLIRSY